jgi:hypothetical protein
MLTEFPNGREENALAREDSLPTEATPTQLRNRLYSNPCSSCGRRWRPPTPLHPPYPPLKGGGEGRRKCYKSFRTAIALGICVGYSDGGPKPAAACEHPRGFELYLISPPKPYIAILPRFVPSPLAPFPWGTPKNKLFKIL